MKLEDFDKDVIVVDVPGLFFLTCCTCGLRHVILIDKAGKNAVKFGTLRDNEGTELIRKRMKKRLPS